MIWADSSQRIVQTRPGQNTGDTYYQTEDGRWWHTHRGGYLGTGSSLGTARDGRMHPQPLPAPIPRRAPEPEPNRDQRRAALSRHTRKGMRGPRG